MTSSRHQAAAQFGVAISTAINWVRRFHETGSVEPDQIGGYPPPRPRATIAIVG
jgi:putative transposase